MRARNPRKAKLRRIAVLSVVVCAAVLLIIAFGFIINAQNAGSAGSLIGNQVPPSFYNELQSISSTSYSTSDPNILSNFRAVNSSEMVSSGKPVIVYIGAEYCPYCAFLRWPLTIALMRFGNFSGLEYMVSSSTDYPSNIPTFSYRHSTYTSNYIIFEAYELQDRYGNTIESLPSNYSSLFKQYGESYPMLIIANQYVLSSSIFIPTEMQSMNWTQVLQSINGNTQLSYQVKVVANAITATICKVLQSKPSVCNSVSSLASHLSQLYRRPPNETIEFILGRNWFLQAILVRIKNSSLFAF